MDKVKFALAVIPLLFQLYKLVMKALPLIERVSKDFESLTWSEKLQKAVELLSALLDGEGLPQPSMTSKVTAVQLAFAARKAGLV